MAISRVRRPRGWTLEEAAVEHEWLWDFRHGVSVSEIAAREKVPVSRVRAGIGRARAQEKRTGERSAVRPPVLVPLFPVAAYTPNATCAHHGPIRRGSRFCCMVCHQSGMDDHPSLVLRPGDLPAPEPKRKPEPAAADPKTRLSRRERRRLQFEEWARQAALAKREQAFTGGSSANQQA